MYFYLNKIKFAFSELFQVNIVVVPEILFLGSGQMRVDEGGSVTLLPLLVPVLSEYYSPLISEYHVTKQPRFGKIISTTSSNSKNSISRFSAQQLQAGQILVRCFFPFFSFEKLNQLFIYDLSISKFSLLYKA